MFTLRALGIGLVDILPRIGVVKHIFDLFQFGVFHGLYTILNGLFIRTSRTVESINSESINLRFTDSEPVATIWAKC